MSKFCVFFNKNNFYIRHYGAAQKLFNSCVTKVCDKSFVTQTQGRFPAPLIKCPKLNFVRNCPLRLTTLQLHVYIYRLMHGFVFNSLNLILIGSTRCLCLVFSVADQKIICKLHVGKVIRCNCTKSGFCKTIY